jgi:YfiH family protein
MRDASRNDRPQEALAIGEGPLARLELPLLREIPGLVHAFTLRGADPEGVVRAVAGRTLPLRTLRQVHGATVHLVSAAAGPRLEGDALVCALPGIALAVQVADCVPLLAVDAGRRVAAAVHAGWRGTVAGVLRAAIAMMRERCGARPSEIRVGAGPSIGPCCFEVGDEVVDALLTADPGAGGCVVGGPGKKRIDLVAANRRQALAAGVRPERFGSADLCTCCGGERFESFRRDAGRTGRMTGLVGWLPPL